MNIDRRTTGRVAILAVAALLGALVAGWATRPEESPPSFDAGRDQVAELPREVVDPPPAATPRSAPAAGTPSAAPGPVPRLLTIPRLGLRMPVEPQGVDRDGAMALPDTAFAVGWYRYGPRPLDADGATVIAGHVDTAEEGPGPLAGLGALRAGDRVEVRTGTRTVTYAVTSVTRIGKAVLNLPAIFSREGAPRLHLLTCGGEYLPDLGGYQDNVVIAARRLPVGS